MGIKECLVDGDSVVVISWGLGKGAGSWCLANIVYKIRELHSLLCTSLSLILIGAKMF